MKYTQLGERGPTVSRIGFGAWAIGGRDWGKTDDEESKAALRTALDEGVTFIDTADVYGFGHSEDLIAEVLSEQNRDNVIIATKAGNDFYYATKDDDSGYGPIRQTYSRDYLIEAAEKSIERLKVDNLDILQLHSPDLDKLEKNDPWDALEVLKRDGKIKHAGLSIQSFKESEQAHLLDEHHDILDCIQVRYNLLEREAEKVLFPKAMQYGIGVIVRIPLLFGLLTGKFDATHRFGEDDHRRFNLSPDKLDFYLKEYASLRKNDRQMEGMTETQESLAFCLNHPACQTVIPGGKTPIQVRENCKTSAFI